MNNNSKKDCVESLRLMANWVSEVKIHGYHVLDIKHLPISQHGLPLLIRNPQWITVHNKD
jgi:hypothetical protein